MREKVCIVDKNILNKVTLGAFALLSGHVLLMWISWGVISILFPHRCVYILYKLMGFSIPKVWRLSILQYISPYIDSQFTITSLYIIEYIYPPLLSLMINASWKPYKSSADWRKINEQSQWVSLWYFPLKLGISLWGHSIPSCIYHLYIHNEYYIVNREIHVNSTYVIPLLNKVTHKNTICVTFSNTR